MGGGRGNLSHEDWYTLMDFSQIISLKPTFLAIGTEPTYMGGYFKKKKIQNFGVRG